MRAESVVLLFKAAAGCLFLNKLIMLILTQASKNVLYLFYMNKEVIYLEPEDDITDILTKLQRAEQKLVALVPPKKATILRSAVNMKLIAKAAKENGKVAVLVTADPAIMKLAMGAKIPVAKTLQSRPVVPTSESVRASEAQEQVIDEELGDITDQIDGKAAKNTSKKASKASDSLSEDEKSLSADTLELTDEGLEKGSKEPKKGKKARNKDPKDASTSKIAKYKKLIIAGSVAGVLLIILLVWALVFAPAVSIVVAISTISNNFSENVNFTTDLSAEDLAESRFYANEQSYEQEYTAEFTATGRENKGEKATGEVTVNLSFRARDFEDGLDFTIPSGARFTTTDGKAFTATESKTIKWVNTNIAACSSGTATNLICSQSTTVPVAAAAAGEDYNISARTSWSTYSASGLDANVSNARAFTGGTTNTVTVVSEDDLDTVKDSLIAEHSAEGKEKLLADLSDDDVAIESSFKVEAAKVESTPAVDEEVSDTTKSSAKVTLKFIVYTVDQAKIEEYIKSKMELDAGQKIYDIGEPYFERFTSLEETARLKTVVETGPTVTEEEILEQSRGRKIGEVQSALRSINGVSSVQITPSYFWVSSVPNDPNKVTIELTVEDN